MTLIIRTTGIEDYLDGGEGRVKALIMGPPGAGKTRSSSFWPKPILADCEDGRMAVADRGIPYARIRNSEDMKELLRRLYAETNKPPLERAYLTLVIDTLDSYQRLVIAERLKVTGNEGLSGFADWGYLDNKMQQLVSALQGLRMNVVVNLHVKSEKVGEDEDGKGGYLVQSPKLKGDLREQIAAEFDLVGYMGTTFEMVNGERTQVRAIQWHATPDRPILKDRSGTLPKFTSVSFTDRDYYGLFEQLAAKAESLKESVVVEQLEVAEPVAPVAPKQGGPVSKTAEPVPTPVDTPPSPPSPPVQESPTIELDVPTAVVDSQAHVPATTPRNVPAAPKPQIPGASSAPAPAPAPEPTPAPEPEPEPVAAPEPPDAEAVHEAAVEMAQEALGATVIQEAPADAAVVSEPAYPTCGQPLDPESEARAEGCGRTLTVKREGGSLVNVGESDQNPDLIEIAGLKTRTWLCNDCYNKHRKGK